MDIVERLRSQKCSLHRENAGYYREIINDMRDAIKEIERLRANNKDLTDRYAILRHDLPVDRIPTHGELMRWRERELESNDNSQSE